MPATLDVDTYKLEQQETMAEYGFLSKVYIKAGNTNPTEPILIRAYQDTDANDPTKRVMEDLWFPASLFSGKTPGDKVDIADTKFGLDFIMALRPVEFRWNYREDYFDKENSVSLENDGSKKRNRLHQGLIGQEVKEVIDKLGVDFAGYQDHSINGGEDVISLGYQELITPTIKALQEINLRLERMEKHYEN